MMKHAWSGALVLALVATGCSCSDDTMSGDGGLDASQPELDAHEVLDAGDICGDGERQRSEACDDGNTEDGDGCSADCTSDESCGNSVLDVGAGELCDDGNTDDGDGCRGDCLSDYRCGNGVQDLEADGATADEVCDDGNTAGGDGCGAACDSDESCGNSVVDVIAGEVCDDGNTDDGDDCSADCTVSLLCGNGEMDGAEECDDGNNDDADGCSASCLVERCGNGRIDADEDCDDANTDDTDGCTAACGFTCSDDAACADTEPCNGAETCMNAGTATSQCVAGAALPEGASCGVSRVCVSGVCATVGCGDGTVTAPEDCDDSNAVNGDGCDADCTWTCAGNTDCADTNACNGAETCTMPSTIMSRCAPGTPPAAGTTCDRDAMPGTRDICRTNMCLASTCGDGFIDPGATPVEQCDDGNMMSGDGCSATCQTETAVVPTGFRITNLDLVSPRVVLDASFFLGGCQDITQSGPLGNSVNGLLDTAIEPMSSGGDYSLHIVSLFRPLSPSAAVTPGEIHLNAACMEAPNPDSCGPDATPNTQMADLMNQSAGNCFVPVAADVNARGTPAAYSPAANTVGGPCFVSEEVSLTVTLSGIVIPLERARIAATYSGTPTDRLVSGVITGFLAETAAADTILPASLPLIGGDSLYEHLQAGNRSVMNSAGMTIADACNVSGGAHEDDADTITSGTSTVRGFWFFLNFEAELVTWTAP